MQDISRIRNKIHKLSAKESAARTEARQRIHRKLVDALWVSQDIDEVVRLTSAINVLESL